MRTIDTIKKKIVSVKDLASYIQTIRQTIDTLVFTNGCFDLIHEGHLDYLAKARDEGDFLIVGLNSDSSIQKIKGINRPIMNEKFRAIHLASLSYVDAIIIFSEETPFNIIKQIEPDILIKGGDYTKETIVGADIVEAYGGQVKTIPFLEGHSTTKIIDKIKSS